MLITAKYGVFIVLVPSSLDNFGKSESFWFKPYSPCGWEVHIYKLSFIVVMLQEDGVTRGEEQDEVIESLDDKGQGSLETTRYVG